MFKKGVFVFLSTIMVLASALAVSVSVMAAEPKEQDAVDGDYDMELDGLLREGFVCVFEDEIRDISVISDVLYEPDVDVEVKWELRALNRETEEFQYNLFDYWKDGYETDYLLDGADVKDYIDWSDNILRMRVALCVGGAELVSKEFTIDYYEKENEYFIDDKGITLVPGGGKLIDGKIRGYIRDQYHPFGENTEARVTDITVSAPEVCSVFDEGGDYRIVANKKGYAEATVSFYDDYGQEQSYTINVEVKDEAMYLDLLYPNKSEYMLPNTTKLITTTLRHEWYYSEEDKGFEIIDDYVINLSTDEIGDPLYNQDLVDVQVLEDGKTLQVDTKDCLGKSDICINTELSVDHDGEAVPISAEAIAHINSVDKFYYWEDFDYDADAKVGEKIYLYPSIIISRIEDGEVVTEIADEDYWFNLDYDSDEVRVDEVEGGLAITRKVDSCVYMDIRCLIRFGDRAYDYCGRKLCFNEVDHEWIITYEWAEDSSKCHAEAKCKYDSEALRETVNSVKKQKKPANCEADEIITYRAAFENDLFENQLKEIKGEKAFGHSLANAVTEATLSSDGKKETKCTVCGKVTKSQAIYSAQDISLSDTKYTYDGEVKTPDVIVKDSMGNEIANTNYTITYSNDRMNVGKHTVKITFKNDYSGSKELSFVIVPEVTIIGKPSIATGGIMVNWIKNSSCDGYYIYRSKNGADFIKVKTIDNDATKAWKDTGANTNGSRYRYKIVAYKTVDGENYESAESEVVTACFISKPKITKLTNSAEGKMLIKWAKNAKATGYEIQYSASKTFAKGNKTVKVTSAKTVSKTVKGLKAKKTYYVRIRSYKTIGKTTYYSPWSAKKSVKIKKK